jgi:hypothetical protein
MAAGYCLDLAGLPISPFVLLFVAGAFAIAARVLLQPRFDPWFTLVAFAAFAYAMWIVSPAFLPVTNGPDVVHHLQLIHAIETHGRLPHGTTLYPFLLEMMNYTPGAHILAAAAGRLLSVDPLAVVYPIAAAFFAVKAGSIYGLGRRLIRPLPGAAVAALAAPLLALGAQVYFLGSFVQFFYFSQIVSEAFAIGMLLALVRWLQLGEDRDLVALGACAVGVVLSWPVWIVPAGLTAAIGIVTAPAPRRRPWLVLAMTFAPAAAFAAVHELTHRGAAGIVTSAGAVTAPSVSAFGVGLLILAAAGAVLAVRDRAARSVAVFLGATLLVAGVLALLVVRAGSASFYMPFKMMYLTVPPAAILGAIALARLASAASGLRYGRVVAACLPAIVAVLLLPGRVPARRAHGSLSVPARDVALWARGHVPPACIDYFSAYWLTGYWLHLDVLGNPRLSDRMREETFEFRDAAAKWIEGRGLPYAIVENFSAMPRDVRVDMTPVYESGAFALVRNRRPVACR